MMTLWVSRSFFIFPSVFPADLLCSAFFWFCNLFFIPSDLVLRFLLVLRLTLLCRVSFCCISGSAVSSSLWFLFDWYNETLGLNRLDFSFYCLPSPWVRFALLLCVLMVILWLFPVLGELGVPPSVWLWLNSEMFLGRSLLPWTRVRGG